MLTRFDELTCHQIVSTFDAPQTTDRAWTEKLWMNVHDTAGKLVLATGFGVYPNRNVMDGYACVNLENRRQWNTRVSRELRPRIDEVAVGPLRYDVLEPYRRIRVTCGENPHGIRFEIEFQGRMLPGEEEPQLTRQHGRVNVHTCRYAQLGRASGWVEVDGQRHALDPDRCYAQRDHSWGIRLGVGAPETGVQVDDTDNFRAMLINWLTLQFPTWGVNLYYIQLADGRVVRCSGDWLPGLDSGSRPVPVVGLDHAWTYHPRSARMAGGEVTFHLADGRTIPVSLRELTTMYLRGGGYVGYQGFRHGIWCGPEHAEGEVWEVGDERVANEVHGLDDTVCEVRSVDEVGYGIVENMILPPFPRYGFNPR
jgi:hypothetical protein